MNINNEAIAVEKLLADYASALHSADTATIPNFYTEDGEFMPENSRKLTKGDLPERSNSFFQKFSFSISYAVGNIVVNGEYAFVEATANTKTVNAESNKEESRTSQDFFVLRKDENEWKIFRYIFNNVKEQ